MIAKKPMRLISRCSQLCVTGALSQFTMTGSNAFEVVTHGIMSKEAWKRFILADPNLYNRIGLVNFDDTFKTDVYFDYRVGTDEAPLPRGPYVNNPRYDLNLLRELPIDINPRRIDGWLIRGSIREDDDVGPNNPTPKDDPRGDFHRVFNHFMDPANNNRPLTVALSEKGANAAAWALDPVALSPSATFPPPFQADNAPARYNNFNIVTVRETQWIALTGYNKRGMKVAFNENDRNQYWTTSFRALGDVLHLNQDMAQPQHTRNDAHSGTAKGIIGHKSILERYTDARVRGLLAFSNRDDDNSAANIGINPQPVNFNGYPTPKFAAYTDYWSSANNRGLANYSNRGFFTIGALPGYLNFVSNDYALPSRSVSDYLPTKVTLTKWNGAPIAGWVPKATVYLGSVPDATGLFLR